MVERTLRAMLRPRHLVGAVAVLLAGLAAAPGAQAACGDPGNNEIVVENCRPGNPPSEWDVSGAGDPSIQGFATDISVAQGADRALQGRHDAASDYRLDIYRMGYYGGDGARLVATVQPLGALPQNQPACHERRDDRPGRLRQLGASPPPGRCRPTAVSGIYFAKLVRERRRPARATSSSSSATTTAHSDLLFQTSDTTWQAYNQLRRQQPLHRRPGRAAPTRSATTGRSPRAGTARGGLGLQRRVPDGPLARAQRLRRQLLTGVDTDRRGAELLEHKVFLSVGHDEYWSGTQRANVEAARDAA